MRCHGCMCALTDDNSLKCGTCALKYCYECFNINKETVRKLNSAKTRALKCPSCQNVTRRKNDDDTPCRHQRRNAQSLNDTVNMSLSSLPGDLPPSGITTNIPTSFDLKNESVTMESISRLFDVKLAPDSAIMINLRTALKKDVEKMVALEVDKAVGQLKTDFTSTTDHISAEQNDLKIEIGIKDSQIKQLETELTKMQNSVMKMEARVSSIEKVSRNLNLEIHEVPESKNENLMFLFKKLCECLRVEISDNDVRACRRVAKMDTSSKRPRNILVTLSSQKLRDLFLSSVTRFNKSHNSDKLATTHIGFTGETRRIYLSEHLSPETKVLHSTARRFCKENNFMFVWVRFGQIYIRKNEQSPAVHVKSIDILSKIKLT